VTATWTSSNAGIGGNRHDHDMTLAGQARFPLTEAAEAMRLSESSARTAIGKIILMP
jgi:hypothetical protein